MLMHNKITVNFADMEVSMKIGEIVHTAEILQREMVDACRRAA